MTRSRGRRWNLADLPIIPQEWKMLVKKESRDLFDNLKTLLKKIGRAHV